MATYYIEIPPENSGGNNFNPIIPDNGSNITAIGTQPLTIVGGQYIETTGINSPSKKLLIGALADTASIPSVLVARDANQEIFVGALNIDPPTTGPIQINSTSAGVNYFNIDEFGYSYLGDIPVGTNPSLLTLMLNDQYMDNNSDYTLNIVPLGTQTSALLNLNNTSGSSVYTFFPNGENLFASHNIGGTMLGGANNQAVTSGTYSPTITSTINVASSSVNLAFYTRVANVITVNISMVMEPSSISLANTEFNIDIPTSGHTLASQSFLVGSGTRYNIASATNDPAFIFAELVNQKARFSWYATDTQNSSWNLTFSYLVRA